MWTELFSHISMTAQRLKSVCILRLISAAEAKCSLHAARLSLSMLQIPSNSPAQKKGYIGMCAKSSEVISKQRLRLRKGHYLRSAAQLLSHSLDYLCGENLLPDARFPVALRLCLPLGRPAMTAFVDR